MKDIDEIKEKIRESERQISAILNKLAEDTGGAIQIASIDHKTSIGGRLHCYITCNV